MESEDMKAMRELIERKTEHRTMEKLRAWIISKTMLVLQNIDEASSPESDRMAAEAANALTSALVKLNCLERGRIVSAQDDIAPAGFVADEWYRENFK